MLLPFALGYAAVSQAGRSPVEALFVGAAPVATSTGITARALRDIGVFAAVVALTVFTTLPVPPILQALSRSGRARKSVAGVYEGPTSRTTG